MTSNERDILCWVAGFYEGEGSVGYYQKMRNGKGCINLNITQKEKEPLIFIRDFFGFGNVNKSRSGTKYEVYAYQVRDKNVLRFLERILPFMRHNRKIEQAKEAILGYFMKPIEDRKKYTNKSIISIVRERDSSGRFIK